MKNFIKNNFLNIAFLIIIFLIGCKKESGSSSLAPSKIQENMPLTQEDTTAIQKEYDDDEDFIVTVLLYEEWPNTKEYTVLIDGYKGNKKEVRIPPEIQNLPVVRIGDNAFNGKQLTSVSIPESVTEIGEGAFSENNLTGITIPNGVREIKQRTFYGNKLTNITMYYGLEKIGKEAFANNQLTNVKIPDSVKEIHYGSFANNRLTSITTPEELLNIGSDIVKNNPVTTIIVSSYFFKLFDLDEPFPNNFYDFYLKEKPRHGIYTWNGSSWSVEHSEYDDPKEFDIKINDDGQSVSIKRYRSKNTTVNIPPRLRSLPVTVVGGFSAGDITSVIIPEGVTRIEEYAFPFNYITSVIIPDSVTDIGQSAFFSNRLTSVTFGKNVTNIDYYAFDDNKLTSITLGNNVTTIGYHAFSENKIIRVKLSDSLKVIYEAAFLHNPVKEITIPENVSILERWGREEANAFYGGFEKFYNENGKKAGTYIYNEEKRTWSLIHK